jgi:hypothetical protein
MRFNHQEIKDWIIENHSKYWEGNFPIDRLYKDTELNEWGFIVQHINEEYFLRVLWLDLDNYTDFYDYPIEDYKMWLREKKLNEILK